MTSKYFSPGTRATGQLQPHVELMAPCTWADFTNDWQVMFDHRQSLDATEWVPVGSVRALDFEPVPGPGTSDGLRIGVAWQLRECAA